MRNQVNTAVKLQLPNGDRITVYVFVEGDKLHVDTLRYGCWCFELDGLREAAQTILEVIGRKP
jgi:hypothetical protein